MVDVVKAKEQSKRQGRERHDQARHECRIS
jgi:hypothetical protein